MNHEVACLADYFLRYAHLNAVAFSHLPHKLTPKPPINEDALDLGKERMLPQFSPPGQRTLPIVRVGWQHAHGQRGPRRINQQKALAAFDKFAPVEADVGCGRGRVFDALAIEDEGSRLGFFLATAGSISAALVR